MVSYQVRLSAKNLLSVEHTESGHPEREFFKGYPLVCAPVLHLTVKYCAVPHLLAAGASIVSWRLVPRDFSPSYSGYEREDLARSRARAKIPAADNRRRVFTRVRDPYDLRLAASSQIRARGEPATGDKIFPPARLSARNSCQQRRAATPRELPRWKGVKRRGRWAKPSDKGVENLTLRPRRWETSGKK